MARAARARRQAGPATGATFICLITMTDQGRQRNRTAAVSDRAMTTRAVQAAGGECRLYSTAGSAYDYVSIMTNISTVDAIAIAELIEQSGNRLATMLPGVPVLK